MIFISIYITCIILFCLWDSFVGWGIEIDGFHTPPYPVVAGFWFISVPVLLVYNFVRLCEYIKDARIERQEKEEKFRIQEEKRKAVEDKKREKEIEEAFRQLEADEHLIESIDNLRKNKS